MKKEPDLKKSVSNISVLTICDASFDILSQYYHYTNRPVFSEFLMQPLPELGSSGQVLFEYDPVQDEMFLGMQFGVQLEALVAEASREKNYLSGHALAVIAEETSHFQVFCDAVSRNAAISKLELEVLGEIDRFLTLMHWNVFAAKNDLVIIPFQWQNLHDICDYVFTGRRFSEATDPIYFDTETLALNHLKAAFAKEWDASHTDFRQVSLHAQNYLQLLRSSFFVPFFRGTSRLKTAG